MRRKYKREYKKRAKNPSLWIYLKIVFYGLIFLSIASVSFISAFIISSVMIFVIEYKYSASLLPFLLGSSIKPLFFDELFDITLFINTGVMAILIYLGISFIKNNFLNYKDLE